MFEGWLPTTSASGVAGQMSDPATIVPGLTAALVLGIAVVADQRSAKRVRPRPVLFPTIFVDLVRQTAVSHAWQNPPSTGFVPPRTGHADSLGSQRRGRRRGSALTQHAIGNRREPTRYNGKRANRRKPEFTGPFKIRTSAMTCGYYRTSSPVTALPMITRWISDVPSKMVKLMEV